MRTAAVAGLVVVFAVAGVSKLVDDSPTTEWVRRTLWWVRHPARVTAAVAMAEIALVLTLAGSPRVGAAAVVGWLVLVSAAAAYGAVTTGSGACPCFGRRFSESSSLTVTLLRNAAFVVLAIAVAATDGSVSSWAVVAAGSVAAAASSARSAAFA